jgi:hypothetical protein
MFFSMLLAPVHFKYPFLIGFKALYNASVNYETVFRASPIVFARGVVGLPVSLES